MSVLEMLKSTLALRSGEVLQSRLSEVAEGTLPGFLPWLRPRCVHEFAGDGAMEGDGKYPLTLLAALAREIAPGAPVAWIGRRCWPSFQFFRRTEENGTSDLRRHLFLDPLSDAERFWGLLEAARCPAVKVVVADGSGLDKTGARRLQLAAEAGNAVVLLARPASEFSFSSWATTRWRVRPHVSSTGHPRWDIALVRAAGARQGQDASRHWVVSWTYEVFRGAGTFGVSPGMGCGTGAAGAQGQAAGAQRQTA